MSRDTVRMGAGRSLGRTVAIAIAAAACAAAGLAVWRFWPSNEAAGRPANGCAQDAECGAGRLCASGGCLPLLGSESAEDWRADLESQRLSMSAWAPRPAFGAKLVRATACPAAKGPAKPLPQGKLSLVRRVNVFDIREDSVLIHVQNRVRGALWVEAIPFSFPGVTRIDAKRLCASPAVSHVEVAGGPAGALEAALAQAVPAGAEAEASLSVEMDLPPPDAEGLRTFEFPLEPAPAGAEVVTVAAMPLGTHVARMSGPSPTRQRLLLGYVAYYWKHGPERGRVGISFASKNAARVAQVPLEELKP